MKLAVHGGSSHDQIIEVDQENSTHLHSAETLDRFVTRLFHEPHHEYDPVFPQPSKFGLFALVVV